MEEARYRKHTMLFSATLEGGPGEVRERDPERSGGAARRAARSERRPITQWVHLADDAAHKLAC